METLIRPLDDFSARIEQPCYFCGARPAKFALTFAKDRDGKTIRNEVACCGDCVSAHLQ